MLSNVAPCNVSQAVQSAMSHSIRYRDVAGEGPLGNHAPATVRIAVKG